jgi:hypothetical protein
VSVAINLASEPPPIGWLAGLGFGSIKEFLAAADPDRPGVSFSMSDCLGKVASIFTMASARRMYTC